MLRVAQRGGRRREKADGADEMIPPQTGSVLGGTGAPPLPPSKSVGLAGCIQTAHCVVKGELSFLALPPPPPPPFYSVAGQPQRAPVGPVHEAFRHLACCALALLDHSLSRCDRWALVRQFLRTGSRGGEAAALARFTRCWDLRKSAHLEEKCE